MSLIRNEVVKGEAILSPRGELQRLEAKEGVDALLEEECRKAFQKGKTQGERIGHESALMESREFLNLLQAITTKMLEQKKILIDQLKPEIIELAIAICEQMIRRELSQPKTLVNLVNSLLTSVVSHWQHEFIQIILSPDDLVMMEEHLNQIQYNKREIKGIRFSSDPLMKRGDCRLETKTGLLNCNISRELADLQSKISQN